MKNQPLAKYSTYDIGGPATYFAEVDSIQSLRKALAFAQTEKLPIVPIGKGSNTLFPDEGVHALVLLVKLEGYQLFPTYVEVGAGYSFSRLGAKTARAGYTGLEFASGIPGTVGGAVFMNAGACGREVKDCVTSVTTIDCSGKEITYRREDLTFSYRTSPFQKKNEIIIAATFSLSPSETAKKTQASHVTYRMETQPYKAKTIGCTFRNPSASSAGQLIEACGLKGFTIGGAKVSPLHANFIENVGGATAQDVLDLIEHIETTIYKQTGIQLEREIRTISHLQS